MEKVFFLKNYSQPLFNFFYENVTGKDFFSNRHIWTNDQYSRPTSIKNGQLADGGNPKYTLRHVLGWGFNMGITPRSCQGHIKVKSAKKGQNI